MIVGGAEGGALTLRPGAAVPSNSTSSAHGTRTACMSARLCTISICATFSRSWRARATSFPRSITSTLCKVRRRHCAGHGVAPRAAGADATPHTAFVRYNPKPARYARNRVAAARLMLQSPVIAPVRLMDYLVDYSHRFQFRSLRSPGLHVRAWRPGPPGRLSHY
jgi:hypothetical protein